MVTDGSRTAAPPELLYLLHGDPTDLAEALSGMRAAEVADALRQLGPEAGAKVMAASSAFGGTSVASPTQCAPSSRARC